MTNDVLRLSANPKENSNVSPKQQHAVTEEAGKATYIPKVTSFKELNLPDELVLCLERQHFTTPTEIQAKAIPPAMEGRDILGSAQTGTGKTFAFVLPMLAKLMTSSRGSALILLPTRELAVQVEDAIVKILGFKHKIRTAVIIGGEPMPKQLAQLRANPRVIVGTPGRINDHLDRGTMKLHDASYLVLDETDRMLDMGFGIQIDEIAKYLPKERQTLLFSATIPPEIARLTKNYLKDPVRISIGSTSKPAVNIKQVMLPTSEAEKYNVLIKELEEREGSVIIFAKTKRNTEKLAEKLGRSGQKVDYIHGDLRQSKRDAVIRKFREEKYRILVATDVAARGLDVWHIKHVVNYDLPQCPEDYIHRIGRTARAGAEGEALSLVSPADNGKWKDIQRLMNPDAAGASSGGARKGGNSNRGNYGNGGQRRTSGGGNNDNRSESRNEGRNDSRPGSAGPKKAFFGAKKGGFKTFGFKKPAGGKPGFAKKASQ
jgi:ATP-dependent RNA helicase DeaD